MISGNQFSANQFSANQCSANQCSANQCSRILALLLLVVMLASTTGAACLLPVAHSGVMGCHSSRKPPLPQPGHSQPGHSQPGHSSCCGWSAPLAVLANVSTVRAPILTVGGESVTEHIVFPAENCNRRSSGFLVSGGPPRILSLRI
jgi:hypothetical protein